MDTQEAVIAIANAMADAEQAATDIRDAFRGLPAAFQVIANNTDGAGTLEGLAFASELDAIATKFRADLYDVHSRMTQRSRELGLEEMLPALRGSGGR